MARSSARRLLCLGLVTLALCSLLGSLAASSWTFAEWMAHFRFQYFILALGSALAMGALRAWRWVALGLCVAALNGAYVVPWYLGGPPWYGTAHDPAKAARLRLLVANVLTSNREHEALLRLVDREQPDLLLLQEIDRRWVRSLKVLRARYPHGRLIPRHDNFGIGLLSRLSLRGVKELTLYGSGGRPSLEALVRLADGREVRVLCTHPFPPVNFRRRSERDDQLLSAAQRMGERSGPRLLVGDLNTSMFTAIYRQALKRSQLLDGRRGRGMLPTWPVNSGPLTLLRVPLDHVWYSWELHLHRIELGPNIGSDHLPLLVDFALPTTRRAARRAPP